METPAELKHRTRRIIAALQKAYPDSRCALVHETPMQLLVAVILSAQCTDAQVNKVTDKLFDGRRTAADFATLTQAALEKMIHSAGFFRNKAKNILAAAAKICSDFGGDVPRAMDELLTLPGVARKTANVVLSVACGTDVGIVVDTHVIRLAARLGLSKQKNPVKIERDLMELVPRKQWGAFGFLIQSHGRACCTAPKPACPRCPVADLCPWPEKTVES